jgi:hypothetical protein
LKSVTENRLPKGRISLVVGLFVAITALRPSLAAIPEIQPSWINNAIWYQIFPERFRNGDPSNDPTIETLQGTWPYDIQTKWQIMPWTADWYKLQPWKCPISRIFYYKSTIAPLLWHLPGILDKPTIL